MRVKPPQVPPAVQLAEAGSLGPRVLLGTYTARLQVADEKTEMKFNVVLDPRAPYTEDD